MESVTPPELEMRSCPQSVGGVSHEKHVWHSGSTDAEYFWCAGFAWKPLDREELISICEASVVPLAKWHDRDTPEAQEKVGKCWAFLRAGCEYRILTQPSHPGDGCVTDDHTIWLEITAPTFGTFDYGADPDKETYYLPTRKRLLERAGGDWY